MFFRSESETHLLFCALAPMFYVCNLPLRVNNSPITVADNTTLITNDSIFCSWNDGFWLRFWPRLIGIHIMLRGGPFTPYWSGDKWKDESGFLLWAQIKKTNGVKRMLLDPWHGGTCDDWLDHNSLIKKTEGGAECNQVTSIPTKIWQRNSAFGYYI